MIDDEYHPFDWRGILITLGITLFIILISQFMLRSMFYELKPHSSEQNATKAMAFWNLSCDTTEIVYYRYMTGFLGITKQVKTSKEFADFNQEECIK